LGAYLAQAHVGAGKHRDRPREAPAVAVEHRQGPQIDRVLAHGAGDDVADREQISTAVAVDDALGVAGGAGRVVERNRVPFVRGYLPAKIGIAAGQELLIFDRAEPLARAGELRIVVVDDERLYLGERQRLFDRARELAVRDQHLGFAVVEREGDDRGIEARVER